MHLAIVLVVVWTCGHRFIIICRRPRRVDGGVCARNGIGSVDDLRPGRHAHQVALVVRPPDFGSLVVFGPCGHRDRRAEMMDRGGVVERTDCRVVDGGDGGPPGSSRSGRSGARHIQLRCCIVDRRRRCCVTNRGRGWVPIGGGRRGRGITGTGGGGGGHRGVVDRRRRGRSRVMDRHGGMILWPN